MAVVVVAMSVFVASCTSEEPRGGTGPDPVDGRNAGGLAPGVGWPEAPPEGYRWVGDRGVVVAVPDWWTTGDTSCLLPVEDTVYVETGGITRCVSNSPNGTHQEVSSLAVITTRQAHGERIVDDLSPDGEIDSEPVLTGQECGWLGKSTCRTVVAVPTQGVAFALHVADPGDVDPAVIRDSLTFLPQGWTTVPLALRYGLTPVWGAAPSTARAYARLLERSGFAVRIEQAELPGPTSALDVASFPKGTLLEIQPSPGSPIKEGGQVVLTVMPPAGE